MACEEAELGQDGFEQKMKALQQLQEQVMLALVTIRKLSLQGQCLTIRMCLLQQLEMLKYMRKFSLDDQSAILQKVNKNKNKTVFTLFNYHDNIFH